MCKGGLPRWLSNKESSTCQKQETQIRSLGQEDAQEKKMAAHSSIVAWKIPWTEEPGGATVHEVARVGQD